MSSHTIPAGTILYRASPNPNETLSGHKYVTYTNTDRNHYRAGWARRDNGSDPYEYEFALKNDLKIPSRAHLSSVINDVISKNKSYQKATTDAYIETVFRKGSLNRDDAIEQAMYELNTDNRKRAWKKVCDDVVSKFSHMTPNEAWYFTALSFGKNNKVRNEVFKRLSSEGYNAISDEASIGGVNGNRRQGIDPLIVFDGNILEIKNVSKISIEDEKKASDRFGKFSSKANYARYSNNAW